MILGHYAEGQDDHYVYLRSTSNLIVQNMNTTNLF